MNKRILAVGILVPMAAAVPIIKASAADVMSVTDTITLSVEKSCTLGTEATKSVSFDTVTGKTATALEADGSTFKIICNDGNGWTLTAKGAGESGHETELWSSGTNHGIQTGTTLDGSASNWAFKLTGTGVTGSYQNYSAIPGTSGQTVAEQSTAVAEDTISVKYTVAINGDVPAGTYTGKVTYTLAAKQAVGP